MSFLSSASDSVFFDIAWKVEFPSKLEHSVKKALTAMLLCSVTVYTHAPVHIYGVTYYSITTTSGVVVAYNTSGPWNLMLSGHANY